MKMSIRKIVVGFLVCAVSVGFLGWESRKSNHHSNLWKIEEEDYASNILR